MPSQAVRLFVGQLNLDATEEDVRQLFDYFGDVIHVKLHHDEFTGRSNGSAFVTYGSTREADIAIRAIHGVYNMGREKPLQVSYKTETEAVSERR